MLDKDEHYEKTAKGDIISYINERKEKATLNWCYNSLKKMVDYNQITPQKIENIILDIEKEPHRYLLDKHPERKIKLENIMETIHSRGI